MEKFREPRASLTFSAREGSAFKKIFRMVRFTLFCFFLSLLQVMAVDSYSQTRLSLNQQNQKLEDVLKTIEDKSEFFFLYNRDLINVDQTVNINKKDQTITVILDELLKGTDIKYSVVNRQIILSNLEGVSRLNSQQQKSVSGKVTDSAGTGLPGVSVIVKGTTNGIITDGNGFYTLPNVPEQAVLKFSFVGMKSQEISVSGKTKINVKLEEETVGLEEVVAVGYGTVGKRKLTSAVSSVKAEDFVLGSTRDAGQLLQGKVAGLSISTPSGDPTQGSEISLRGINSIGLNSSPLVLIDGIPGDLKTVAPEDIESVDVLKDGSAAAIYGTRGTNGVILISTRKPDGKGMSIQYTGKMTTESVTRRMELLSASEFRQKIKDGKLDSSSDFGGNTDWQNEIMRTPFTQDHNLTISSGNSNSNFLANLNYRDAEGIFLMSDNNEISGRLSINHSMLNNKLKINLNMLANNRKAISTSDQRIVSADANIANVTGQIFNTGAYRQALIANPTMPLLNKTGKYAEPIDYGISAATFVNPVATLKETNGENSSQSNRFYGNLSYLPIEGLKFNTLFSFNRFNEVTGYSETLNSPGYVQSGANKAYASRGTTQMIDKLFEFTGEYVKAVNKHNFTVLGGYGYQASIYENFGMNNYNFPTDQFTYNNMALGQAIAQGRAGMYSSKTSSNLISFFGRFNYDYDSKYLASISVRHEGSSKFVGSDQEWGTFPAVSLGWRINKESFMEGVSFVNDLKLRTGYGVTGNAPDALYRSLYRLRYTDLNNSFYSNGQYISQLVPASNPNPEFTWEKKSEMNFGLDFAFANNRISGSIDWYNRTTRDLLYEYPVPVPPNTFNTTYANVGKMENKGLEILLNTVNMKTGNFEWSSTFTFSTNKNKLVSLNNSKYDLKQNWFYPSDRSTGEPIQAPTHRVTVGEPIGQIWGWKAIDITDAGRWVYEDKNGKAVAEDKITADDRKVLGNGLPKFYAGFNNTFKYKWIDLGITMRGAFKYQIINFQRMFYENPMDQTLNKLSSAYDKVFGKAVLTSPRAFNSYYVENGDFWKIDNITLGFNIPAKAIKGVKSARIYLSTLNTMCFTNYKGIDPEVSRIGLMPGNDYRDKYPSTRVYTLGVNLNF